MPTPLIAVIEDNVDIVQMLDYLLREEGYQVISSTRGVDAYQFIRRVLPDVIILDLWLEHSDSGFEVLDQLEGDPGLRSVPVIVCSAHVDQLGERRARLDAKGYRMLVKPFYPDDLLNEIRAALSQSAAV